jgi:hypothetical protein
MGAGLLVAAQVAVWLGAQASTSWGIRVGLTLSIAFIGGLVVSSRRRPPAGRLEQRVLARMRGGRRHDDPTRMVGASPV